MHATPGVVCIWGDRDGRRYQSGADDGCRLERPAKVVKRGFQGPEYTEVPEQPNDAFRSSLCPDSGSSGL